MKFRFCGDLDAPDWILADLPLLTKLPVLRFKLLCGQVVEHLLKKKSIDFAKVDKHAADAKFSLSDTKAAIAELDFIFQNAVKYEIDESILKNELQQLGLPKEHSEMVAKLFRENFDNLKTRFTNDSFRITEIHAVDWRADLILGSSDMPNTQIPTISIKIGHQRPEDKGMTKPISFEASSTQFRVLLNELRAARSAMAELEGE